MHILFHAYFPLPVVLVQAYSCQNFFTKAHVILVCTCTTFMCRAPSWIWLTSDLKIRLFNVYVITWIYIMENMIWSWLRSGIVKIAIPILGNLEDSQDLLSLKVSSNYISRTWRTKVVTWNNWISKDCVWLLPFSRYNRVNRVNTLNFEFLAHLTRNLASVIRP